LFATGNFESILSTVASSMLAAEQRGFFERIWYAQGHLHPIVVHFPIALLMAAAVAASLRPFTARVNSHLVYFCLLLGVGGAILSCLAGWAWAPQEKVGYDNAFDSQSPIFWHRWGGIGVTFIALGILIWASLSIRKHGAKQWPWEVAVVVCAMITGWVGHEGGELVYPDNAAKIVGIATGERSVVLHEKVAAPTGGSFFAMKVLPIFQAKCIDCHGPDKQKGKMRMDTEEWALKGGTHTKALYVAGNPNESALIAYVTAPDDDSDPPIMPPTNAKRPVTPEEVAILKQWISEGASWSLTNDGARTVAVKSIQPPPAGPTTVPATMSAKPPATAPATRATTLPTISGAVSGSLFATKIQPMFQEKCVSCHGSEKIKGGLRMDTAEWALKGGDAEKPLYVKGKSADSVILAHVNPDRTGIDEDDFALMPPKKENKPVTAEEFAALKKWIDEGAKWDK
jgi:mono/diheme cytochrome c family protein/uncharacterized membrane protein